MQAIIYNITPFDADIGTTIKFIWNGNQVFKNRCIIKKNDTNEIVYDNTVDSFKLEHEIDLSLANLINGQKYNVFITVFDKENNESDIQSLGMSCLCLKTPIFQFKDIADGQIIASSSYEFSLEYSQENGELLDSWSITIYNKSLTELAGSGVKYNTDEMSYTTSGFSNNTEYVIRGQGQTINGMPVDTGYIDIAVSYQASTIFSTLDPINVQDIGAIHIRSNIISLEGKLDKDGIYIDNEFIDLRDNVMTYDEGFAFSGDFSFVLLFYGMKPNDTILTMYDDTGTFQLDVTYRITKAMENRTVVTKSLFELMVTNNDVKYVLYSNKLPLLTATDMVGLKIARENCLYDIKICNYIAEVSP